VHNLNFNSLIMSNLLQIEADFLNNSEVRQHVRLDRIQSLQADVTDAKKVKFEKSLKLADIVKNSHVWFNSEDGKRKMQEEGITWNIEDFSNKVFGWQKSYFFKMLKVGTLKADNPDVVSKYKRQTTQAENNGQDVPRSVSSLLKFAKAELSTDETETGEVVERPTKIVSLMLMSDGSLKATGDKTQINRELVTKIIEQFINN